MCNHACQHHDSVPVGGLATDYGSRTTLSDMERFSHCLKFVMAVDRLRNECGAAVLAVHHSGKVIENGMRGSSVLPAAADTVLKTTKVTDELVKLEIEKQKAAKKVELPSFRVVPVEVVSGIKLGGSIVLVPDDHPTKARISKHLADKILLEVEQMFREGTPLNASLKDKGRNFTRHIASKFNLSSAVVESQLQDWLKSGTLLKARVPPATNAARPEGYRVGERPVGSGGE